MIGKATAIGWFIQRHLPAWHGLKLATEILGKSIPAGFREAAEKYRNDIKMKLNLAYEAAQANDGVDARRHGVFEEWESSRGQ